MNILSFLTRDQIAGILKGLIAPALGYFVAKGYVTEATSTELQTGIVMILAAIWQAYVNRPNAIIKSAQDLPKVQNVIVTDKGLAADPSLPKVISPEA